MNTQSWTTAWPLQTYYAAYIDPKKSLPHLNDNGKMENVSGYPFFSKNNRYIANINDYIDCIADIDFDEYTIIDPVTTNPLIKFRVEKGHSAIWDDKIGNGMLLLQYTNELMAYRKRDDGFLGIESLSKSIDTRLSIAEDLKNPGKFPDLVKKTNKNDANFSNIQGGNQ